MSNYIEVPAAKLVISERYQARPKRNQLTIPQLAHSIYVQDLLQNLVVVQAKKKGTYEVVAGGRRLEAIQLLLSDGRWAKDRTILVKLVESDVALEVSIIENVEREALHPADEFEAFAKLLNQGKTVEDVAATFGVTPTVVKGRMRLAHVAPQLLQAYRGELMSLQLLMAFTVTEDHERQLAVWNRLDDWDRKNAHPSTVRKQLTEDAHTAEHGLARFVGLDAYVAAGGRTFEDLFAEEGSLKGIYLQDVELLQTLAQDKLQAELQALGSGWAWVQGALSQQDAPWGDHSAKFGRVYVQERKLTKAEAKQVKELTQRIDALSSQMDILAEEDGDDDEWQKLDEEHDSLVAQRAQIHETAKAWPDEAKQFSGVGVYVAHDGNLNITYGLIRPEDRKAAQEATKAAGGDEDGQEPGMRTSLPAPMTRPTHSEKLVKQLTANKVGIVGVELAARPDIALAVLVAQLTRTVLGQGYWSVGDYGLGISLKTEAIHAHAADFEASKAGVEMAKYRQHWMDTLPLDGDGHLGDEVLRWALEQDTATLLELLAFILGTSVQGVQHTENTQPTVLDALATTIGVDASKWWEPTAESYLKHVSKGQITTAVARALGEDAAAPLEKLKKGEAVAQAEQLLQGKGWLPQPLQVMTMSDS